MQPADIHRYTTCAAKVVCVLRLLHCSPINISWGGELQPLVRGGENVALCWLAVDRAVTGFGVSVLIREF